EGDRLKKMVTPAVRREAVTQLRVGFEVSERRACTALEVDRSSVRYRSSRPDDAMARARLRELAALRRRFGYRRLHILMSREGLLMNHKKFRRLVLVDAGSIVYCPDRPHLAHSTRTAPSLPIRSPKMIGPSRGMVLLSRFGKQPQRSSRRKNEAREL